MSQSNKKSILFLIVFALVSIGLTFLAVTIVNKGNHKVVEKGNDPSVGEDKKEVIKSDGLGIKSLDEKYQLNDLHFILKEEKQLDKIESIDRYPIEIRYYEIEGLKDKSIQKSINQKIKDTVYSSIHKERLEDGEFDYIDVEAYIESSYANVLSIEISSSADCIYDINELIENGYNKKSDQKTVYLNFDLNTGNEISFTDLFTNDASLRTILSQSAYYTFAQEYLYDEEYFNEDLTVDMDDVDYSSIEDRVLKVLQNFDSSKNYPFFFSEAFIVVEIAGETISIDMRNFADQIAIYHRFLSTENLFEEDTSQILYVFVDAYPLYDAYKRIDELADNYFLETQVVLEDASIPPSEYEEYILEVKNIAQETQKYLNDHPDEAIVLAISSSVYEDENGEITHDMITVTAKMSKDYYEKTFAGKVKEWERGDKYDGSFIGASLISFLMDEENDPNISVVVNGLEGY